MIPISLLTAEHSTISRVNIKNIPTVEKLKKKFIRNKNIPEFLDDKLSLYEIKEVRKKRHDNMSALPTTPDTCSSICVRLSV